MDDDAVVAAVDMAIDSVMRRKFATCEERDAAMRRAIAELHVDG